MTILSNHRVHSYKATASKCRRDISPKKVPLFKTGPSKRVRTLSPKTRDRLTRLLKIVQAPKDVPAPPPSSPMFTSVPQPSAPPAITYTRTIYVWNTEYQVQIPDGFDIYEGLRIWYPDLYNSVLEQDDAIRSGVYPTLEDEQDILTQEDMEAAWEHYEYLEYMCDF